VTINVNYDDMVIYIITLINVFIITLINVFYVT